MARKKILVLGGTQFIGRHLVERLLSANYEITLFNRQKTNTHLFQQVPKIKGDRNSRDINQINRSKWDIVIDLSCYFPESLQNIVDLLPSDTTQYMFISSCSAYNNLDYTAILKSENTPTLKCEHDDFFDQSPSSYGARKAECERILENSGLNYVILRPALVVGPYDHTDRFYYWLYQVLKNEPLLLPNNGESRFSITYVKDLVQAITSCIELNIKKDTFNIISHPQTSINKIVKVTSEVSSKNPKRINATPDFLLGNNIDQWIDMPLWINGDHFTYSNLKMKSELNISGVSLNNIISETIDYFQEKSWPTPGYGMDEERRKILISDLNNANN